MPRDIAIVVKDDEYFLIPTSINSIGISVLTGPISRNENLQNSSEFTIGDNIVDFINKPIQKLTDEEIRKIGYEKFIISMGFKSRAKFYRDAFYVAAGADGSNIFMQPSIRRGSRSVNFEFLSPIYSESWKPSDVGSTFRSALSLCR